MCTGGVGRDYSLLPQCLLKRPKRRLLFATTNQVVAFALPNGKNIYAMHGQAVFFMCLTSVCFQIMYLVRYVKSVWRQETWRWHTFDGKV